MATARDVVEGALKLLGVKPAESGVTSSEATDGLDSLNDMAEQWNLEGAEIGYETIDDLDDELFVDDGVIGALKANLAVYMAPEYDRTVTPELALRAKRGKTVVQANVPRCPIQFPDTLPVGVGNERYLPSNDGDSVSTVYDGRFYPSNRRCN